MRGKFIINKDIISRTVNGKVFIYSDTNKCIINKVGIEIWECLILGYSYDEIICKLRNKYPDVNESLIVKDVSSTIEKLKELDIISELGYSSKKEVLSKVNSNKKPLIYDFYKEIDFLYKVVLELTYKCNNRCLYCYNGEYKEKNVLSTEKVKDIIDESYRLGVMHLSLTGGEPLLRKDIVEIIKYAHNKKMLVSLQTNGTLITEEFAKELEGTKHFNVAITVHSHDSEIHDQFTKIKGSHEKAIEGIKILRKHDIPVKIRYVLTTENYDGIDKYDEFARDLDVEVNKSPLLYPTAAGSLEPLKFRINEEQLNVLMENKKYYPQKDPCGAGKTKIIISPEGKVYPCSFYHEELGDINESTIEQIINSNKTKQIQKLFEQPDYCKSCDMEKNCPRCPVIAYFEKNNFKGINSFDCMIASIYDKHVKEDIK